MLGVRIQLNFVTNCWRLNVDYGEITPPSFHRQKGNLHSFSGCSPGTSNVHPQERVEVGWGTRNIPVSPVESGRRGAPEKRSPQQCGKGFRVPTYLRNTSLSLWEKSSKLWGTQVKIHFNHKIKMCYPWESKKG